MRPITGSRGLTRFAYEYGALTCVFVLRYEAGAVHVIYVTTWNFRGLAYVEVNSEACATDEACVARLNARVSRHGRLDDAVQPGSPAEDLQANEPGPQLIGAAM